MPDCSRCNGQGEETYDEDGRLVTDVCYHCSGSGKVDDETDFQDRLAAVACVIAHSQESDYRKACDSDPEGDGYNLGAYENQMMPFDYFRSRVWDRTYDIAKELSLRPLSEQEFLLAWNECWSNTPIRFAPQDIEKQKRLIYGFEKPLPGEEDEIPF